MSVVTVSNSAQLQSALASAQGGDVINLAAGSYGDVSISKSFSSDVLITSLDANAPAVFHSLSIGSSANIHIDDISVAFTPTASTYAFSPAVSINASSNITFTHSTVTGGAAVNGVATTATALDSTQNVLGQPTGYGISITSSNTVTVSGVEVSQVNKGIVLSNTDYLTLSHNDIHDFRTSGIVGGGTSDHLVIDSNHIHDSNPWNWGVTPLGDHADFLALWTNSSQTTPATDIHITNNVMEQGSGTAVLGMWLQGGAATFTNVTISGNTFLNGNFQGITLWDVNGGTIDHNTLLQTSGTDFRSAPGILLSSGVSDISVSSNITGSVNDQSGSAGSLANSIGANTLVQMWKAGAAGYYNGGLVALADQLNDFSSIYGSVAKQLGLISSGDALAPAGESIAGGAGNDVLYSTTGASTVMGGGGDDSIFGAQGPSYLRGGDGNDLIVGLHGFNDINGNAGNDTIFGGDGNDWLVGGQGNDVIHGGGGAQILLGNLGNDTIIGGTGNETIRGGQGDDSIVAGAGNDWISGDRGNDTIMGGAGADTFHTFAGAGVDWVLDFNSAQGDRVAIDPGTTYTLRFDGTNTIIDMGNGDQMVLAGVTQSNLGNWLAA